MRSLIYSLCLCLSASAAFAQQQVTGYVYNDENGNGKRDAREKGIANVAVSNGVQVTTTDSKGKYTLAAWDDETIFVIKPANYQVRVNEYNQPQFFYIHKPAGSPSLKYAGIAPTGPLPASVDFALRAVPEQDKFRALVFGDPQVYDEREVEYFKKTAVDEVTGVKDVAFGISMGDLAGEDLTLHKSYIRTVAKVGIPWYNVMGNHDMNSDAKVDSLTDETFESNFGPATYAYNYGKAHILVVNDNLHPDPGFKGFRGGMTKSEFTFIENDLKLVDTSHLVILAMHVPLYNQNPDSYRKEDRDRLFSILQKYPHVFVLSAHTHNQRQDFYGADFGWTNPQPLYEFNIGTTCGNWWSGRVNEQGVADSKMSDGTPRGYAYLNVDGNQYTADYKVSGMSASYQIGLFHRKVMNTIWWEGRTFIYANFFMGWQGSKVECRIDDKPWKAMKFVGGSDPAFINELYKWDDADTLMRGRRPTEPGNSTHLWTAPLPENIGLGDHKIEVRATDVFGRTFVQESSYRIENPKW
jgi:hypothetical protein